MSKITQKLEHFKQYDKVQFEAEGPLVVYLGRNGKGKSTAIQAFEECIMAKGFVKEPIKHGEIEANTFFKYYNKEDDPIQISCTITSENAYSITCGYINKADGKVKNTSDPKKIREIIGIYYPLTVGQVLEMTAYAEGRRKFIDSYLLPLLGDVKKTRLQTLQLSVSDKKNKSTEGNLYFTRRTLQEQLQGIEGELKASTITEEDKATIASKNAVEVALGKLKAEMELHKDDGVRLTELNTEIKELREIGEQLDIQNNELQSEWSIDVSKHFQAISTTLTNEIAQRVEKQVGLYNVDQRSALQDKITRGNNKLTEIATLSKRTDNTEIKKRRDEAFEKVTSLNEQIEKNKNEIKEIFTNSALPAGITIDEETIMLNGFELSESTNSTTEIKMSVIELLCQLNTSGFVNIGEYNDYDDVNKKKIFEYAQKNGFIFIGQQVSNDETVHCETLIIN